MCGKGLGVLAWRLEYVNSRIGAYDMRAGVYVWAGEWGM